MAPSSVTPNFSRPLPSPLSTSGLDSPVRGSRSRGALTDLPHSATLVTMTHGTLTKDLSPSKSLFAPSTNSGHADKLAECEEKHASNALSPTRRHKRSWSKPSLKSPSKSEVKTSSLDFGGGNKPITNFRPQLWPHLKRNREALSLDLFVPIKPDEINDDEGEENSDGDPKGVFPFRELKPLQEFHNLHSLQLNGMMRSYQPLIWATCWVNKHLTKVRLEMAQEPVINDDIVHKYRKIDTTWSYNRLKSEPNPESEYLGSHGQGVLHEEFGDGEYLDQQAMKAGQMDMVLSLPVENMRYLPIIHLTLMNFVVDSGPFFRWFDPRKLKEITFLGECIDAGFFLPEGMRPSVTVNSPKPKSQSRPPMIARVVKPGEAKLVEINQGKPEQPAQAMQPTATPAPGTGKGDDRGSGLKGKMSQIMPRWGSGSKKAKDGKEGEKDKDKDAGAGRDTAQLEKNLATIGL